MQAQGKVPQMEIRKLTRSSRRTWVLLFFIAISAAVATSCSSNIIKGRPPFVSISSMSLIGERLNADFDIRNQNGVPMNISMIDIRVTVNGVEMTRENREFQLQIGANSAEQVSVESLPGKSTRELLQSLENKEVNSLPFDLEGRVRTVNDGYLAFSHKGYLYPVPGKPGYYRSAVTRAKGLRREEDF